MKKTFIVAAVLLSIASASFAQNLTGGVKIGLNSSNIRYVSDEGTYKANARLSGHLGVYAVYMFKGNMGFQPEFVISGEGTKNENGNNPDIKVALTYINIPLLLRFNVIDKLNLHTGPQIGFLVSAKNKYDGNTTDVKDNMKGVNLSWGFGAGYELPKNLNVSLRYNLGLSRIDDSENDNKAKVSTFQISLGYKLF
jgi:long-subunit fatty acid transport protein